MILWSPISVFVCCCFCDLACFQPPPPPQTLWSLISKDVFEQRTSTGIKAFSLLICLDAYEKFVLLNFFTLIETIPPKIWAQPLPMNGKKFTSGWCASQKRLCLSSLICLKGVVSYTQATVPQLHHLACRFFSASTVLCQFSLCLSFTFFPLALKIPASPLFVTTLVILVKREAGNIKVK